MNETALVTYLLANRHRLQNRVIIACLALNRLNPQPSRRVTFEELMEVWQVSTRSNVVTLVSALRKADLIAYDRGATGHTGYRFWRVGPERRTLRETHPHRG